MSDLGRLRWPLKSSLKNRSIKGGKMIQENFKVGDHVCWNYSSTEIVDHGIIESIEGDLMSIRLPEEGSCKVSTTAGEINGRWLVYWFCANNPIFSCNLRNSQIFGLMGVVKDFNFLW